MATALALYHLAVLLGLLFALSMVLANVACFHGLEPTAPPSSSEAPLVSILVPGAQ